MIVRRTVTRSRGTQRLPAPATNRQGVLRNRGAEMYTADEVDVLVVHLVPEDAWYIIPIRALGTRHCLYFHPNGRRREMHQYEQYREARWLLKAKYGMGRAKGTR